MGVETIAAVMTLRAPQIIDGAWTGIFGQKNFLAINMFILYISALAIALDKGCWRWFRLVALGAAVVGLSLVVLAKSGTTTIMVIGATGALLGHALLWRPASRIRHMRTLLALVGAVLALVIFRVVEFPVHLAGSGPASQIVMPVVRIDDRPVGNGAPGSVADLPAAASRCG